MRWPLNNLWVENDSFLLFVPYIFWGGGDRAEFSVEFSIKQLFNTLPVIQRERGIYASCAFLSQHFYNLKIIIRYETCEKYRKKKYIRVFCFLSYMSIVAVFSNKFATLVKKGRTNVSRASEMVAQIFMLAFSSSTTRKGAQLISKSKRRERDNVVNRFFHSSHERMSKKNLRFVF